MTACSKTTGEQRKTAPEVGHGERRKTAPGAGHGRAAEDCTRSRPQGAAEDCTRSRPRGAAEDYTISRQRGAAGTGATPAAFYLGLCRLRGTLSPPASATTFRRLAILSCRDGRCRRAILYRHDDYAASIRKSGPEIKNHCTQEGVNRQNHAAIPKSGLEIKNRCTQEGLNGEKLTSIPKSEPEIKNRCSYKNRRRNYSSLQLRKLESDADLVAAMSTAGETILLRGNEIRIGRGSRCR